METSESPLVGLVVRVIDEQQKEHTFGKVGTVVSYLPETKEVKIQIDIKDKAPYKIVIPETSIQDTASLESIKRGKTLRSLSRETKQAWIQDIGVVEQQEETACLTKELAGIKPVSAEHLHLIVFWKHLRWSLEMPLCVKLLDPAIIELRRIVVSELELFPDSAEKLALRGNLERIMKFHLEAA